MTRVQQAVSLGHDGHLAAGNYVAGSELDCIGLRFIKWTRTDIEFGPGTAYDHPKLEDGNTYVRAKGDAVQVDVRGATANITY